MTVTSGPHVKTVGRSDGLMTHIVGLTQGTNRPTPIHEQGPQGVQKNDQRGLCARSTCQNGGRIVSCVSQGKPDQSIINQIYPTRELLASLGPLYQSWLISCELVTVTHVTQRTWKRRDFTSWVTRQQLNRAPSPEADTRLYIYVHARRSSKRTLPFRNHYARTRMAVWSYKNKG